MGPRDPPAPAVPVWHRSGFKAFWRWKSRKREITEVFPWASAPAYLVRDNDGAYGHAFTSRVRAMGIRDRPTSPGSPWQNGYAERLIGTVRRECIDRMLIFGEAHLRRVLASYVTYYNQVRTHLALGKDAPLGPPQKPLIGNPPDFCLRERHEHRRMARIFRGDIDRPAN